MALLGGAFNPVTLRHMAVAQYVLDVSQSFDEVWFLPCYQHMFGKQMESPEHRLAMLNIARQADGRVRVFGYEIEHEFSGETYNLVTRLLAEDFAQDKYEFSVILGMDNANVFHTFVNHELLERMIPFVVVPRQGVERDESVDWYLKPPHISLIHSERHIPGGSSTGAREILEVARNAEAAREGGILDIVHPSVAEYIFENKLYGFQG